MGWPEGLTEKVAFGQDLEKVREGATREEHFIQAWDVQGIHGRHGSVLMWLRSRIWLRGQQGHNRRSKREMKTEM